MKCIFNVFESTKMPIQIAEETILTRCERQSSAMGSEIVPAENLDRDVRFARENSPAFALFDGKKWEYERNQPDFRELKESHLFTSRLSPFRPRIAPQFQRCNLSCMVKQYGCALENFPRCPFRRYASLIHHHHPLRQPFHLIRVVRHVQRRYLPFVQDAVDVVEHALLEGFVD